MNQVRTSLIDSFLNIKILKDKKYDPFVVVIIPRPKPKPMPNAKPKPKRRSKI